MAAIESNPERSSPWGQVEEGKQDLVHLPTMRYTRSFLKRNKLTLRRSMPIHNGRAVCTVQEICCFKANKVLRNTLKIINKIRDLFEVKLYTIRS